MFRVAVETMSVVVITSNELLGPKENECNEGLYQNSY